MNGNTSNPYALLVPSSPFVAESVAGIYSADASISFSYGGTNYSYGPFSYYYGVNAPSATVTAVYANGANPLTVPYNSSVLITWNATNATSCTCSYGSSLSCGSSTGSGNGLGGMTISNLKSTTTFNVTCLPL